MLAAALVRRDRAARAARSLGWACPRTFGSLGLLLPMASRALPLLLLFVTFLFINTEVVAGGLEPRRRGAVAGRAAVRALAVLFLLVRLPEEVDGSTTR